jgi:hypothetical protein
MRPGRNDTLRFLAFRYYDGCPVGCAHCSIEAPTQRPRRNSVTARDVVALCRLGKMLDSQPLVFMTGAELLVGEPEFIDLAAEIVLGEGMVLAVLTSGYWARTKQGRREGLDYLRRCGVSHVQLSVDSFHYRALNTDMARDLVIDLLSDNVSVLINETLSPGEAPISPIVLQRAGAPPSRARVFTRNSVGAAARLDDSSCSLTAPYHACDFGDALYLQADGNLYLCSGPASMCPGRSVGCVKNGEAVFAARHAPSLGAEVASAVEEARSSHGDECLVCLNCFKGRDSTWVQAGQLTTACS